MRSKTSGLFGKFGNTARSHSCGEKTRRRPCYASIFSPCSDDRACEKFVTEIPAQPTSKLSVTIWVLLALIATTANTVIANPEDRKKAINVTADNSEFDERAGTQVLSGNVEISQGSMSIKADTITIELKNDALYRITGTGNPIKFQQLSQGNELMRGESNQISYNTQTAEITFKGEAEFERPGQKLSSHTIEYNMQALTFKAAGNQKGRVSITLQPGKANP